MKLILLAALLLCGCNPFSPGYSVCYSSSGGISCRYFGSAEAAEGYLRISASEYPLMPHWIVPYATSTFIPYPKGYRLTKEAPSK